MTGVDTLWIAGGMVLGLGFSTAYEWVCHRGGWDVLDKWPLPAWTVALAVMGYVTGATWVGPAWGLLGAPALYALVFVIALVEVRWERRNRQARRYAAQAKRGGR